MALELAVPRFSGRSRSTARGNLRDRGREADEPVTPSVPDIVARASPTVPAPDQEQLEALARDLAALRQSIDKLTAGQERMARDSTRLETAEKEIRHRLSVSPRIRGSTRSIRRHSR